jgi:hypothetical protein
MSECVLGGKYARFIVFLAIALAIVSSPVSAESTATFAAGKDPDINASCRIPFEALNDPNTGKSFALSALLNENAKLAENLRQRYIVADLNSTDENGNCRGVQEYFTPVGELSEFPRLRAIAAARKTDVASLAKESVEALVASEERPGDSAGLALELEDLQNYRPLHSITSSAATCRLTGTVSPSALAVLRFIVSPNLVGCTTGRSAGFSPLRIRPV